MDFFYNHKKYVGVTATEIVLEMARDAACCPDHGSIRDFLRCALAGLADGIHVREHEISSHLSDETLAFNYLCLLDEYGIGRLHVSAPDAQSQSRPTD